jgi:Arc/MetJ-type ribon-helix-helix transcriptional regulator
MQIVLEKPEFENFIRQQVDGGHYPSPASVVEAALSRWMTDHYAPGELERLVAEGEASLISEGPRSFDDVFARLEEKSALARSRAGQ